MKNWTGTMTLRRMRVNLRGSPEYGRDGKVAPSVTGSPRRGVFSGRRRIGILGMRVLVHRRLADEPTGLC